MIGERKGGEKRMKGERWGIEMGEGGEKGTRQWVKGEKHGNGRYRERGRKGKVESKKIRWEEREKEI